MYLFSSVIDSVLSQKQRLNKILVVSKILLHQGISKGFSIYCFLCVQM